MTFNPCQCLLTWNTVSSLQNHDAVRAKNKMCVLSTLTTTISTITWLSAFINSVATSLTALSGRTQRHAALKLWLCRAALLLLIKRSRFRFTCPGVSNEGDSKQKLPYTNSLGCILVSTPLVISRHFAHKKGAMLENCWIHPEWVYCKLLNRLKHYHPLGLCCFSIWKIHMAHLWSQHTLLKKSWQRLSLSLHSVEREALKWRL